MNPQTILRLTISNVKRLTAVEIEPVESVTVIGGRNGAGKSSVLDSIEMLFRGSKAYPEQPIRHGEKSAKIIGETEDFVITRSITQGGGTLTITSKDGRKYASPQAILDGLFGQLSFDPMNFKRLSETADGRRKQAEILRGLVGLDFTEIDAQKKELYDNRTLVGRDLQAAKAVLAAQVKHADVGTGEMSLAELTAALRGVQAVNAKRDRQHAELKQAKDNAVNQIERSRQKIADLENALKLERTALASAETTANQLAVAIAALPEVQDDSAVLANLQNLEAHNVKVRANRAYADAEKAVNGHQTAYDEYTAAIQFLDKQRADALAKAKFPVPGLAFDDAGVTHNGTAFAQINTAEQIRISVAMGIALNPMLRVLLVREGTLLDEDSQRVLYAMAQEHGYQVWVEIVSTTGEGCSVVIEDGAIKE